MLKSAVSRTTFDIAGKRDEILRIEREMAEVDFWDDRTRGEQQAERLALLKRGVSRWEHADNDLAALRDLAASAADTGAPHPEFELQLAELETAVSEIEREVLFAGRYDRGSAVLSIFAGAGGKDAEDWAAMLRRMYERWAERQGYGVRALHEHFGELEGPSGWGLKNASIEIRGPYAYGRLKGESGVHRLVRISPFSAKSLRHTSFTLVEVMPEFVRPEEVAIERSDLKTDFFRSSGPGGQNVNKRETAVRITHLPTGTQVAVQVERSQERNREIAMRLLAAKLYQLQLRERERESARLRGNAVAIEWGSQIRSYVLHPYQLVKDHRTACETAKVNAVLDGELDDFLDAELRWTRGEARQRAFQ